MPENDPQLNGEDGDAQSLYQAISKLERDVERLEERLNTERFIFIVFIIAILDAIAFAFYKSSAAPFCITIVEFAGLFVLAKRLGVSEIISLFFEIIKSWGKREVDPPADGVA